MVYAVIRCECNLRVNMSNGREDLAWGGIVQHKGIREAHTSPSRAGERKCRPDCQQFVVQLLVSSHLAREPSGYQRRKLFSSDDSDRFTCHFSELGSALVSVNCPKCPQIVGRDIKILAMASMQLPMAPDQIGR